MRKTKLIVLTIIFFSAIQHICAENYWLNDTVKSIDTVAVVSVGDTAVRNDTTQQMQQPEEKYMKLVKKLERREGWIHNRNSGNHRGIYGYVKGVYYGDNKIFLLIELHNTTEIEYEIDNISFISSPIRMSKQRQLSPDETIYSPIWQTDISVIDRKSVARVIFVFDKFVVAENKNVMMSMYEIDGERNLVLKIKPDYFLKAEYLH